MEFALLPTDWLILIKAARNNNSDFKLLLAEIEPVFQIVANHIGKNLADDLIQVARIKVWKSLHKINLNKPETIKSFLIGVGINEMRDFIRKSRKWPIGICDDTYNSIIAINKQKSIVFNGVLCEYEKHIKINGKFNGAHQHLAKKYKISVKKMRTKFHNAVKKHFGKGGVVLN